MRLPPSLCDRLSCRGASAAFGARWDIFQWLEKSRGFCFGLHAVFRALHYTHCFCEPRQSVQHSPLTDARGKAKQADDVSGAESSLLQKHIIFWGFCYPFCCFPFRVQLSLAYICAYFLRTLFFSSPKPLSEEEHVFLPGRAIAGRTKVWVLAYDWHSQATTSGCSRVLRGLPTMCCY